MTQTDTSEPLTKITVRSPANPPKLPVARDPMQALLNAISQGTTPEILERLMMLHERWERNEARKAYERAMAAAKGEIKPVTKNRKVGFDAKTAGGRRTDYQHEDLAQIELEVGPVLSRHGLNYRFRTLNKPGEPVMVTCIIAHEDGHFEENSLSGPIDASGNKNPLQAIGSAVTYLQRYTLKAALGLSAAVDDDAQGLGKGIELVTGEQAERLKVAVLEATMHPDRLLEWATQLQGEKVEHFEALHAELFDEAMRRIAQFKQAKIDKKKRDIAEARAKQEALEKAVQE